MKFNALEWLILHPNYILRSFDDHVPQKMAVQCYEYDFTKKHMFANGRPEGWTLGHNMC